MSWKQHKQRGLECSPPPKRCKRRLWRLSWEAPSVEDTVCRGPEPQGVFPEPCLSLLPGSSCSCQQWLKALTGPIKLSFPCGSYRSRKCTAGVSLTLACRQCQRESLWLGTCQCRQSTRSRSKRKNNLVGRDTGTFLYCSEAWERSTAPSRKALGRCSMSGGCSLCQTQLSLSLCDSCFAVFFPICKVRMVWLLANRVLGVPNKFTTVKHFLAQNRCRTDQ